MTFLDELQELWNLPQRITELKGMLMSKLDDLQASADRTGAQVRDAVALIPDLRAKLAAAEAEIRSGQVDQNRLSAIIASIDATGDALASALNPIVEDPNVPTADAEAQPDTNPQTTDPGSVDGSVPAGDPLPDAGAGGTSEPPPPAGNETWQG